MPKEVLVVITEDDPYSRDLMMILLARDWRTRVVGEFGSDCAVELASFLGEPMNRVDVMLVDTETPCSPQWPAQAAQIALAQDRPPALLYMCTRPEVGALERALQNGHGYVVKGELLYALASAVSYVANGYFVITPQIQTIAGGHVLPRRTAVINGRQSVVKFTQRETDLARLSILFNLAQRDIADELVLSPDFVAEVTGQVYEKLGVREMIAGNTPLETYFNDETVLAHMRAILPSTSSSRKAGQKAPGMSTIAFHLLTVPEIEELTS
jgi:DNA-binding NarL/FixJ family response regulator